METQGLIFRQKDDSDGRMVRIFLTEVGMEKRKHGDEEWLESLTKK